MYTKYIIGSILAVPLLPLLYFQGRKVKKSIPELPEADGPIGVSGLHTNPEFRVLVLGESTMAGVGVATHNEGFTGTLGDELSKVLDLSVWWKVQAKSGITVGRIKSELLDEVNESEWDMIVVGIGGNDAFKLNNPFRWKTQTRSLIEQLKIKFSNVPIVFTNMPPIKEFPAFTPLMKWTIGNLVELLGEALDDVVAEYDKVYYSSEVISIASWSKRFDLPNDTSLYFSDGVHPSKLTYQTLARQLVEFITEQKILDLKKGNKDIR